MGDAFVNPPIEAKPRWGEVNDPQKTPDGKPAVERWRAPGAAAAAAANSQAPGAIPAGESNAAAAGRGRGFAVGRGRGVMKSEWLPLIHTRKWALTHIPCSCSFLARY